MISSSASQREDGWIFFPTSIAGSGSTTHTIRFDRKSPADKIAGCLSRNNGSRVSEDKAGGTYTIWNKYPQGVQFHGGKTLAAIESYHFANVNLGQTDNALEKYFFTREYGFTRWEAWQPRNRCYADYAKMKSGGATWWALREKELICNNSPLSSLNNRCRGSNQADMGGQVWVRTDCRDSTNYLAVAKPYIPVMPGMADSDVQISEARALASTAELIPGAFYAVAGKNIDAATHGAYHEKVILAGMTYVEMLAAMGKSSAGAAGIHQVFQNVLGRNATASELSYYQGTFASGANTVVTLREALAKSPEAATKINSVYEGVTNRAAAAAEITSGQNALRTTNYGAMIAKLRTDLSKRAEVVNLIKSNYKRVWKVDATASVVSSYQSVLASGTKTIAAIIKEMETLAAKKK
jgi:hypothetical protein